MSLSVFLSLSFSLVSFSFSSLSFIHTRTRQQSEPKSEAKLPPQEAASNAQFVTSQIGEVSASNESAAAASPPISLFLPISLLSTLLSQGRMGVFQARQLCLIAIFLVCGVSFLILTNCSLVTIGGIHMKHDIESFSPKSHTPLLSDLSLKKVMKVSPGTCSLMGEEVDLSIIIMFLPLGIEDPFALSDFNPVRSYKSFINSEFLEVSSLKSRMGIDPCNMIDNTSNSTVSSKSNSIALLSFDSFFISDSFNNYKLLGSSSDKSGSPTTTTFSTIVHFESGPSSMARDDLDRANYLDESCTCEEEKIKWLQDEVLIYPFQIINLLPLVENVKKIHTVSICVSIIDCKDLETGLLPISDDYVGNSLQIWMTKQRAKNKYQQTIFFECHWPKEVLISLVLPFAKMQRYHSKVPSRLLEGKNTEIKHAVGEDIIKKIAMAIALDAHVETIPDYESSNLKKSYNYYLSMIKKIKSFYSQNVVNITLTALSKFDQYESFLFSDMHTYKVDVTQFCSTDFVENGPMVGVIPLYETVDRLTEFRIELGTRERKYDYYKEGKRTFLLFIFSGTIAALAITHYCKSRFERKRRQFSQRVYRKCCKREIRGSYSRRISLIYLVCVVWLVLNRSMSYAENYMPPYHDTGSSSVTSSFPFEPNEEAVKKSDRVLAVATVDTKDLLGAYNSATVNDEIVLNPGTTPYTGVECVGSGNSAPTSLCMTKAMTIRCASVSASSETCTLDGLNARRVVIVETGTTSTTKFENLVFTKGKTIVS